MDDKLIWFLCAVFGFFINKILQMFIDKTKKYYNGAFRRFKTNRPGFIVLGPSDPNEKMTVGGMRLNFTVLQYAHYTPEFIRCLYTDKQEQLTPYFEKQKECFIQNNTKRKENGEYGLPFNGCTYKLLKFDVSNRDVRNGEEIPVLQLTFGPTDYFTQLVTDLNTNDDQRNIIAKKAVLTVCPIKEFASILGVNFNLITKDGFLIITHRSSNANVNADIYHTSVGENLSRPLDADHNGAPNLFNCAIRGIKEEIGIDVKLEDIEFTTFGVFHPWCQYKIIGWSQIEQTKEEVASIHSTAQAKDRWENSNLFFVPCNPNAIAEFVVQTLDNWYDIGLACVVLSLFQMGYSHKEIHKAFERIDKQIKN